MKPSANGHLGDTYKLPNHMTFSDESVYSGKNDAVGGKWVQLGHDKWAFQASPFNVQQHSKDELKGYFDRSEPGNTVIFPDGERYIGKRPGQSFTPSGIPGERITSTTRSAARNAEVGGVVNSFHLTGQARDSVPPLGMTMTDYAAELRRKNPGLQVLNEGTHVHMEPR